MGLSMEDAVSKLSLPMPDYLKIDVDGIEHIILSGGLEVLKNVKEMLIEINDNFQEQADQSAEILLRAGLVLKEKHKSEAVTSNELGDEGTFNQVWVRI